MAGPGPSVVIVHPDGSESEILMIRMLAHTLNAEFKAKHGMFLPGVNKLNPTVKALRDEYGIPARTWADAAGQMRKLYDFAKECLAAS